MNTTSAAVPASPPPAVSPAVTPAHWYSWLAIKADLEELEDLLGFAAKYAPAAGAVADIAEAALGQPELVPLTGMAVGGLVSLNAADVAAHSGNITAVLQGVQATVTAAKTIAAGAVAATTPAAPQAAAPAAP